MSTTAAIRVLISGIGVMAVISGKPWCAESGTVAGHVNARAGLRPLPWTLVSLVEGRETVAFANGEFAFPNVAAGACSLWVVCVGFDPWVSEIAILSGETTEVQVTLVESAAHASRRVVRSFDDGYLKRVEDTLSIETIAKELETYHGEVVSIDKRPGQIQLRVRSDEGLVYEHWFVSGASGSGLLQLPADLIEQTEEFFQRASALSVGDRVHVSKHWWGVRHFFATGE